MGLRLRIKNGRYELLDDSGKEFKDAKLSMKNCLEMDGFDDVDEWDVEIELEPYGDFVDDGNTHVISVRPKLDPDGCVILRRI
jgi:hypothetical protein